jgi:hypothetical protein
MREVEAYTISPKSYFTDFAVSRFGSGKTRSDGLFRHKLSRLDSEKTRPMQQMGDDSSIEEEQDHDGSDDCKRDYLPPSELTDLSDIAEVESRSRIESQNPVQP